MFLNSYCWLLNSHVIFRLQELTYDPNTDTIEVVRFNEKSAQNDEMNTYKYEYLLFEPYSQKYTKVVQVSYLKVELRSVGLGWAVVSFASG